MLLNIKNISAGLSLLASATTTNAWSYVPTSWIKSLPHNGGSISKFQPYLRVNQACVPYPSVIDEGSGWVGEGLRPTGAIDGGCASSIGQVYARTTWIHGMLGIYYVWYFPKDQVALGPAGHVHDWEGVVVWTSGSGDDATLLAVCPARHGTEQSNYHCDTKNFYLYNDHPRMEYHPDGGTTHALFTGSIHDTGYEYQPMAYWEWMPQLCKDLLHLADYGTAKVPIRDENFMDNMYNSIHAAGLA